MKRRWETLLPEFSLERRVTILVLMATALVVGAVATVSIPLELIPAGYTEPFLAVSVPWQDAPSQEVVDKIILPLEEELSTVRGLDRLNSMATTGYGRCFMVFKQGTEMDVAYREVRDRIQRARRRLPDDADRIYIRKHDASGIPIAFLGVAVDAELVDAYDLIQKEVILPLSRIDGVAAVESWGLEKKEILIELDRDRVQASGLDLYRLAQELSQDNFTLASGTVRLANRKLLLRSVARYADIAELENLLVAPSVRLKDVASVKYEVPETRYRARVDSKPAFVLEVFKEGQANTLEVSRQVRLAEERMRDNPRLQHVDLQVFFDQGSVILESLETLVEAGLIGGVLAFGVLFFFLRRFRMTAIIGLSIPLSIVVSLTVMYFAGETLNVLSLLGLMICVGLLVDNSVVVAENIHRMHRDGLPRRQACIRGAGEIALAITTATLTTIAVFLPVSLVEGMSQFFLLRLSIPISVSLLASLWVALVFIPLTAYLTLSGKQQRRDLNDFFHRGLRSSYEASFGRLNRLYGRILAFFLARRLDLVIAVVAVMGLAALVFSPAAGSRQVRVVQVDEEKRSGFELRVRLPQSTTFEEITRYFDDAEKVIEGMKEELGLEGYFTFHRTSFGVIEGWFTNPRTSDLSPSEVTERVVEALPEKAGVKIYTGEQSEFEEDKRQSIHVFNLHGDDPALLEEVASRLEELFVHVEGVVGVKQTGENSPSELALRIDRDRAQRQGINPRVVAGVVGYALRGQALPKYYRNGREIPVRIRFQEADRESLSELADFAVPTDSGEFVPLTAVTDVSYLPSAQRIFRQDKQLSRQITLELAEGREEEARGRLMALSRQIDLPEGVSFGAGISRRRMDEDFSGMAFAGALSVVFIYFLMGFLFESFILPISILLTIPLATIGVAWIHFAAALDIDFLGVVGGILLIGVVVNNGIVLIDYVNRLRQAGHERSEAIQMATQRRFRPIMMTALTTICGMVPLTVAPTTSIGWSYTSFGLTLIGGMTTATFLTLLVVPVFYTLVDDARVATLQTLRQALSSRPRRGRVSEIDVQAAD